MICAYNKIYLDKARIALGRMLDYAVHDAGYSASVFFNMFIQSGIAARFERGDCDVLVGKSGVELAYDVMYTMCSDVSPVAPQYIQNRSVEYWTGWALAYYQWRTARSFSDIIQQIPLEEIQAMYMPYHEMDIRQFVDEMNRRYHAKKSESNLKLIRLKSGLTQKELADLSGVPLRTLQQYEQKQKNINKAQAEYVIMLSQALFCNPMELLEINCELEEVQREKRLYKYATMLSKDGES